MDIDALQSQLNAINGRLTKVEDKIFEQAIATKDLQLNIQDAVKKGVSEGARPLMEKLSEQNNIILNFRKDLDDVKSSVRELKQAPAESALKQHLTWQDKIKHAILYVLIVVFFVGLSVIISNIMNMKDVDTAYATGVEYGQRLAEEIN